MQQTNNDIHFKVQLGNELRRFAVQTPSFEYLESTVRKLFCVTGRLIIKYLDDENDLVSISSDTEFQHAIELSTMPLRLTVEVPSTAPAMEEEETTPEESWAPPFRGGRGRGRGKLCNMTIEERLSVKSDRLTKRIENLERKMESNEIPNQRARVLLWRLEKMKCKLDLIHKQQEAVRDGVTFGPCGPGRRGPCAPRGRGGAGGRGRRGGRGRGGRGGRGGWWRNNQVDTNDFDTTPTDSDMTTEAATTDTMDLTSEESSCTLSSENSTLSSENSETPVVPKNLNQKIRLCRQSLNAAKKSGNQHEIDSCETALEEALEEKRSKQQARKKFNEATKQQRARVQQCKVNLRNARQTGQDKEVIDSCVAALQSAKMEMQEVRASLSSTQ